MEGNLYKKHVDNTVEQARIKTLLKRDTEKMLINIGKATKK